MNEMGNSGRREMGCHLNNRAENQPEAWRLRSVMRHVETSSHLTDSTQAVQSSVA
jgi:hypothetical protein